MKNITIGLVIVFAALWTNFVFAGSPLIHTKFYSAYYLNEKVQLAEQVEFLDGKIAGYLADKNVSPDLKVAVINALQWNEKGKNNIETYQMFLGRKYGKSQESLNPDELTGDELLCLGYMISLDKSRKLTEALPILEKAKNKNSQSYTTQLIYSLALAQNFINKSDACQAWTVCNNVRNDAALMQDLNAEAIVIIFEKVDEYKEKCK
jgi:hypothetical protein